MKARLTRPQRVRNIETTRQERKVMVAKAMAGEISNTELREFLSIQVPAGHVIEHPKAYRLVQLGVAEPADDECKILADFTAAQITAAQLASEKLESGNALPEELDDQNTDSSDDDEEEEDDY